jgi:hypothetical protein
VPNLAPLLGTPDLGTFFTFFVNFGGQIWVHIWTPKIGTKNGPLLKI